MTRPRPRTSAAARAHALTAAEPERSWYRIAPVQNAVTPAEGDDEHSSSSSADVYVYDTIGGWLGMTADDFVRDVASLDVDTIRLHLNTPGGDVFEGVAIANVLRAHRASVHVIVDGLAASAGTIIAMAGDEIIMGLGAQMMIHEPWGVCIGDAADMERYQRMLLTTASSIAATYAARAGGTAADWRAAMAAESWYTGEEAVTAGLADRVANDSDRGSATGEQVTPGGSSGFWDLWDSYSSQNRFDLSVFHHAGRQAAPPPAMPGHRTPPAPAGGPTSQNRSPAVAFSDEQLNTMRQKLGLPADADETTIVAAFNEALEEQAAPTAALPPGVVAIDSAQLDELRNDAAAGRAAREQQMTDKRAGLVRAAVRDGRIPKAREQHWLNQLAADPGAEDTLAKLEPGLIPVDELGVSGDEPDEDVRQSDAYKNWSI